MEAMPLREFSTWTKIEARALPSFSSHQNFVSCSVPPSRRCFSNKATVPRQRFSVRGNLLAVGAFAVAWLLSGASASLPYPQLRTEYISDTVPSTLDSVRATESPGQMRSPSLEFAHGTTTLAFVFQGGIIVAVDSRASLGTFIGSKTVQKVLPIHPKMLGTMAGGAADCSFWIRKLAAQASLHEAMEGKHMTIARASRILSSILYQYRGAGLSVGTMIMGYDEAEFVSDSRPHIFYVDDRGTRLEGDMFAVGSGSTYALAVLDGKKDRHSLTTDQAIQLAVQAIRYATFRDGSSGGFINVYHIAPGGEWKRVFRHDVASIVLEKKL